MRLLFVTPYFPPTAGSGVQRGAKFVKYLLRLGWDVRVVTIDPAVYPDHDEGMTGEVEGARVDTVGLTRSLPFVEHEVLRALPAMRRAIDLAVREHRPDVLFATTPDFHWRLVASAARRHGIPFALDYPDPWTVLPDGFRVGKPPKDLRSRLKWRIAPAVERRLLESAAFATFATEPIQREYVLSRYLPAGKAFVLENGFDPEDFEGVEPAAHETVRVAHIGSFGGPRTPLAAARAVAHAAERRSGLELSLIGAGEGPYDAEVRAILGDSAALRATGWVTHPLAVSEMISADVLWLDAMVHLRSAATGKIYEYLRAGRPILALAHPESPAAELVRRFHVGRVVTSDHAAEAGEALLDLIREPFVPASAEDLVALGRGALAKRLSDLLRGVTK